VIRVKGEPIERPRVTLEAVRSIVTRQRKKPEGSGRKRVHETGAARQKAYRERQREASLLARRMQCPS
jgi:hypothetical protein